MLASLAIALTTLPMPSDVVYTFDGPSYGTVQFNAQSGVISEKSY